MADVITLKRSGLDTDPTVREVLMTQESNLLSYWSLDTNFNNHLASPPFSIQGGPLFTNQSKVGIGAAQFNGATDSVEYGNLGFNFTGAQSFSAMGWVKISDSTISHYIMGTSLSDGWYMAVFGGFNNKFIVKIDDGVDDSFAYSTTEIAQGTWYHFAMVQTSSQLKGYINGQLEIDISHTNIDDLNDNFFLGDVINANEELQGVIDEVALYSIGLSEADINAVYNAQKQHFADKTTLDAGWTPHWNNVVGYWKMDGNWRDSSGKDNHGTSINNPSFERGKVGTSSVSFNGIDQKASLGTINSSNPLSLSNSDFSIAVWVKADPTIGAHKRVIDKSTGTNGANGYSLAITSGGSQIQSYLMGSSSFDSTTDALMPGQWSHIVYTQTANEREFYVNGILNQRETGSYVLPNSVTADVAIGGWPADNQRNFYGQLDDLALWSLKLSSAEIVTIYDRQKQKYAGHFDSEVIDLGSSVATWPDFSWSTKLPFGKELVGDFDSDGALDGESSFAYSSLAGNLSHGLVGLWHLNEDAPTLGPGNDFLDSSANNNFGEQVGSLIFGDIGLHNKSPIFDDSNYIRINSPTNLEPTNAVTVSAYVKRSGELIDFSGVYSSGYNNGGFLLVGTNSNKIRFYIREGLTWRFAESDEPIDLGTWHHILGRWSSSVQSVELFIDGKKQTLTDTASTILYPGAGLPTIGSYNTVEHDWVGSIDEVAVWSRDLSDNEVKQLYRRGFNRLKLQVKSCVDSACNCKSFGVGGNGLDCDGDTLVNTIDIDDAHRSEFIGPGGDGATFYSELFNRKPVDVVFNCALNLSDNDPGVCLPDEIKLNESTQPFHPEFLFTDYAKFVKPQDNRYAQYRIILESDANTACGGEPCFPEFSSLSFNLSGEIKYCSEYTENKPKNPIHFTKLISIKIDADSCVTFRLARNGTDYYFNSGSWQVVSSEHHRNSNVDVENNILEFENQFGAGPLELKVYLKSDPTQTTNCTISDIDINYQ